MAVYRNRSRNPPVSTSQTRADALPRFNDLVIADIQPQLQALLDGFRREVAELVAANAQPNAPTWSSLMAPLEDISDRLEKFWSPVSHLNAVMNSDELRAAYDACIPLLSAYHSEMGQHRELFEAVTALAESDEFASLSQPQKKTVENLLRDFKLSGVALEGEARERYKAIQQRLSELSTQFSNNVLDATQGWEKWVSAEQLKGVPDTALDNYRQAAAAKGGDGYRLTLDAPAYLPIMQYAEDRELRRELYEAYNTRASELGPQGGQWDNGPLMVEIVQLRAELAQLLGFASYAELSLAPKMAESPQQVLDFLRELASASREQGLREYRELAEFAAAQGCDELQAWDVPFYSERLREQRYAISQEQLRPYFPAAKVIEGFFAVTGQLFGIEFAADDDAELWHRDAHCYRVLKNGEHIASCYLDLYARDKKRGGAWMADYCGRRRDSAGLQKPVAFLTCNFSPPAGERPALLTHNEVTTLFHEFGHGLHHMLTDIDVLAVSGINGVAWDAVELPSQFMENWCWQSESIPLISGHYQSGEPLPAELLDKLLAAKNFQSGLMMLRQLEFALFDLLLHSGAAPASADAIQQLLDGVRAEVAAYPLPAFNRFQHGFTHIFAGGYAAGYYSYKWAEVLSADAFSLFEEEGVMNADTGRRFVAAILSQGGAEDAMEQFVAFRGREPSKDALLRHCGIDTDQEVA